MDINTPQEFQAYLHGLKVASKKEAEDYAVLLLEDIYATFSKFMANYIEEHCFSNDDDDEDGTEN